MAGRRKGDEALTERLTISMRKTDREEIERLVGTQDSGEKLLSASDVVRHFFWKGRQTPISNRALQGLEEFSQSVGFRELSDAANVILEQFLKLSEEDQWALLGISKTAPAKVPSSEGTKFSQKSKNSRITGKREEAA